MRLAAVAALVLAGLAPPALAAPAGQDAMLEEVLGLMEKRAEGLRDLTFRVANRADRNMGIPRADVSVTYVRGAGLRVRVRNESMREPRFAGLAYPSSADYIYTPDRYRLLQEWDDRPTGGPMTFQALEIRTDDPAFKSHDHVLLPTSGYPMRMLYDEPLLYYRIAPRMFFGFEPNLAYEGKRAEAGKSYHVLASTPAPIDPRLPRAAYTVESRRKLFFIDPATGAVARIRWEVVFKYNTGGAVSEQRMAFVSEASGEQKAFDGLALPESVRWTSLLEGRNMGRGGEYVRTVAAVRANTGRAPSEVLSDAERDDLYGDAVVRQTEEYEARLKKDPKDASAHYALAQARGIIDQMSQMMRGGAGGDKAEASSVVASLEKAAELRPKADGPVINLLAAYRSTGEANREKDLLARIEKGGDWGERVRFRAASRLNALGEVDRAAKLLDGLSPALEEDRRRAVLERLLIAAAKADAAKLTALFSEEAAQRGSSAEKIALVRSIEARAEGLPDAIRSKWTAESLGELVEKGVSEHPGEISFRVAKAALLRSRGKSLASAAELLEAAPADAEVVEYALDELDPSPKGNMIVVGGAPAAAEKPTEETETLPRLVAALEKVSKGDPRVEYQSGRTLTLLGKADDARRKFEEALEACRAQGLGRSYHGAALRTAFLLGVEKGADGWRDRCVEAILALGKDSGSVPFDLLYDENRNPIIQSISEHLGRKEWLKAYRICIPALRLAGGANYIFWRHREMLRSEGVDAIKKEVLKESSAEPYVDLADFLEAFNKPQEAAEILEKATEKAPKDLELLERLARKQGELGRAVLAEATYERLIPQAPAERRAALRLELVQVFVQQKELPKAKESLAKIDPKSLDAASAVRCADLCAQSQEVDRAIAACRRAYELGLRPHFLMGKCHEKKRDFFEAIRYYNRDRAEGSTAPEPDGQQAQRSVVRQSARPRPPGSAEDDEDPQTGQAARDRLLKKLGPEWLVRRFLDQTFEPLAAEESRKVRGLVEKLASDDVADRDGAFDGLRTFGPRAAPLLSPLLKSEDEEVKTRVRQLIAEWAEPK